MLPLSHSFSLLGRKSDGSDETAPATVEQRICALEAALSSSQRLVCQLLERNERLRMQVQNYKEQLSGCVR